VKLYSAHIGNKAYTARRNNKEVLTKVYFGIWAIVSIAAAILFLTGNITMMVITAFGFVAFGLVFMGMMGVLPAAVSHPPAKKTAKVKQTPQTINARETAAKVGGAVASYFDPKNVQVQRHRHP
jgi:hypothetical protein